MNPTVSVIIPTYNRDEFVAEAVDSVLRQTMPEVECIVVNDGSTDSTARELSRISDSRLMVVDQENKGVSAARNAGIANAAGSFIALLDSDDYWLPEKLERQLALMQAGNLEISQTDEIWIRNGKRVNPANKHAKPEGMFFERSLEMCLISPSCVMFSREYWRMMGPFDEDFPACEDYDLWLRTCLKYPVGLEPAKLVVKRGGRPDQLSNSVPCLDLYRMHAIMKVLAVGGLTQKQRGSAETELRRKAKIFIQGCRKRGREKYADQVWNLICKALSGEAITLKSML